MIKKRLDTDNSIEEARIPSQNTDATRLGHTAVQAGIVLRTLAAFQKAVELCADGIGVRCANDQMANSSFVADETID